MSEIKSVEQNKKRITKSQIVAFALLSLLPIAVIVFGIKLLITGTLVNFSFLVAFFILPILAITLFALVLFLVRKRSVKIGLCILVSILYVCSFSFINTFGLYEELNRYENEDITTNYSDNELMPDLSEIAKPEKLEYYEYFSSQMGFFTCDADVLICKYNDSTYKSQKAMLDEKYVFQNGAMCAYEYECTSVVEIDGYVFRALSIAEYDLYYPKELILIATNDTEKEIVYMSFYDDDLDYIDSLEEFIMSDCGWKHIR